MLLTQIESLHGRRLRFAAKALLVLGSGIGPALGADIPVVPGQPTLIGSSDYACVVEIAPPQPAGQKGSVSTARVDHPTWRCRTSSAQESASQMPAAYRLDYYYTMPTGNCGRDEVSFTESQTVCGTTSYGFNCVGGFVSGITSVPAATINQVTRTFSVNTPSIPPPQARDDTASATVDSTANPIDVTANDLNAEGASVGLPSSRTARGGTVALGEGGGRVLYTPPSGFSGQDSFTYQLTNCAGSSTATVTVTVTAQGPSAQDAQVNVSPGGPTTIDMIPYVRNATSISVQSPPSYGTAMVSGLRVTYTPGSRFSAGDKFTYIALGPNGSSSLATVALVAGALNSGLVTQGEVFRVQTHHITNSINRRITQLIAPRTGGAKRAGLGASPRSLAGQAEPLAGGGVIGEGTQSFVSYAAPEWDGSISTDDERWSRRRVLVGGSEGIGILASALGLGSDVAVSAREARVDLPAGWLGLSAGDQPGSWGGWGNLSYTRLENNQSVSRYDGRLYSIIGGADYRVSNDLWLGAALSYENSNIDTDYNDGRAKSDGFVLTPYLAYTFSRTEDSSLGVSLMAGYGSLNNSTRRDWGTAPVSGSFDADRWLLEADLNWYKLVDRWTLHAFGGYLWSDQDTDAFSESDGTAWSEQTYHLRELKLGGEATYRLSDAFEPYLRATYYHNSGGTGLHLGFDPAGDVDDELELLVGFNWMPRPDTTASFEISHGFADEDFEKTSFMLNVHMEF